MQRVHVLNLEITPSPEGHKSEQIMQDFVERSRQKSCEEDDEEEELGNALMVCLPFSVSLLLFLRVGPYFCKIPSLPQLMYGTFQSSIGANNATLSSSQTIISIAVEGREGRRRSSFIYSKDFSVGKYK